MMLSMSSASPDFGLSRERSTVRPGDGLERCAREQAEILNRSDVVAGRAPAWLVMLGIEDWECEKRLIEAGV
jgi:hypothetical protein